MSNRSTLLVEGRDDLRFFKMLLDELNKRTVKRFEVNIDTADMISSERGLGNRAKVELISETIGKRNYKDKFLGFVDREYRLFQLRDPLKDQIQEHQIQGRLVWSRGHSIENYLFDFTILREPLRDFSVSVYFDEALDRLESSFEHAIGLACALTLAAKELDLVYRVRKAIDWQHIICNDSALPILDAPTLNNTLVKVYGIDNKSADEFIDAYKMWLKVVKNSDFNVVRWLCHGHIGLRVVWSVYARYIHEICTAAGEDKSRTEVSRVLGAQESVRFNAATSAWARKALGDRTDSPVFCIRMLGRD